MRRRYLLGCLKAFLKSGFERKFYDLGKVGYWGPQSKKNVDFHFDASRRIAPVETGDWKANAERSRKMQAQIEPVMACGGGTEQMADDDSVLDKETSLADVKACGGSDQQMADNDVVGAPFHI